MPVEKNYKASTGVDEFYYAVLAEDTETSFTTGEIERVRFLQTITIENPQEVVRAYGDNTTAELAVSDGATTVTSAFHKLPTQDKDVLFGLEKVEGLSYYGPDDNPPYVACVFAKTHEDGSKEWVGLTKGMFMKNNTSGTTKGDGVEFGTDEVSAEFMSRYIPGVAKPKVKVTGYDESGSTVNRDALFTAVFGKAYPAATLPEGV